MSDFDTLDPKLGLTGMLGMLIGATIGWMRSHTSKAQTEQVVTALGELKAELRSIAKAIEGYAAETDRKVINLATEIENRERDKLRDRMLNAEAEARELRAREAKRIAETRGGA